MGRSPCCDDSGLMKGPWTPEEDQKLVNYINKHGHGSWRALPKLAGLNRCGKSCRLRWTNYLRPDIKRGKFSQEEEETILNLHFILGNKWSAIAGHLPGRTDNEIKNFWNTHLKKKLIHMGYDPMTHKPRSDIYSSMNHLIALANLKEVMGHKSWDDHARRLQAEAAQMAKLQYLQYLLQIQAAPVSSSSITSTDTFTEIGTISNLLNPVLSSSLGSYNTVPAIQGMSITETTPFSHMPNLDQVSEFSTVSPVLISQDSTGNSSWNFSTSSTPSPPSVTENLPRNYGWSDVGCSSLGTTGASSWPDSLLLEDTLFHEIA